MMLMIKASKMEWEE